MSHEAGKYKGRKNWAGVNKQPRRGGKEKGCLLVVPEIILRLLYRTLF